MAATLTSSSELTYFSFPIEKTETTPDGDLYVYGKATDETLDSDEQIIDKDFSSKAVADWLSSGANVRVQHNAQRDPAGVGVEASTDGAGATWVKSLVVEPVAKRLVEKGALRAYSVGIARPKIVRDAVARGGRIVGGEIVEISLVDRPANKSCGIQLVKAADDGTPEWVGKVFGADILTKAEVVNVDLPKSASITFSPADLAKLLEHRRVAEERLDKGTLSTDQRDDLDDKHFAYIDSKGGRHLPVHDAGHVKAAMGRFNQQEFESEDAKRKAAKKILSRARDMGIDVDEDSNVAQAVKTAVADTGKGKKGKGKQPFPGAAPPLDGKDSDGDGTDTDKPGSHLDDDENKPPKVKPGSSKKSGDQPEKGGDAVAEPDVEKAGGKACPKCGKNFHSDSKLRNCDSCGADLPHAEKGESQPELKALPALSEADLDRLVAKLAKALAPAAAKGGDSADQDDTGDEPDGDDDGTQGTEDAEKSSKPTPDGGAVGAGAAGIDPVPAHREPDGTAIESFESDAKLPTTPDASAKAIMRLKSLGAPRDLGVMHDLLCPGYHPADVAKCYPGEDLPDIRVADWQAKALDAAVGAPLEEATKATTMWQHAVTIKGTEPQILAEIRAEAHKAFQDANPGPGTFPTPTELSAQQFRRAYMSAGRANPGLDYQGPNTHTVPSGGIAANQFDRGYLADGRAADSPSNKGDSVPVPAPLPTGEASRVYYRNTQRESAKAAMQAMHDHIAQTFPDLCPMGAPGRDVGQNPVPAPARKSEDPALRTQLGERVLSGDMTLDEARAALGLAPTVNKAAAPSPDLVKSAVAEATAPLLKQLQVITEALVAEQARTENLQKAVEALGDLPDPAQAAFKGVAQNPLAIKTARPAGVLSVADIAERTQRAKLEGLYEEARSNPDPGTREAAWSEIHRMTGILPN